MRLWRPAGCIRQGRKKQKGFGTNSTKLIVTLYRNAERLQCPPANTTLDEYTVFPRKLPGIGDPSTVAREPAGNHSYLQPCRDYLRAPPQLPTFSIVRYTHVIISKRHGVGTSSHRAIYDMIHNHLFFGSRL